MPIACSWSQEYRVAADREFPTVSYTNKINDSMLKEHFSVGPFTRLLILTDIADAFGAGLVEIPMSLGTGVHIGDEPLNAKDVVTVKDLLNGNGNSRLIFGGAVRIDHVGHAICELRQGVYSNMRRKRLKELFSEIAYMYSGNARATRAQSKQKQAYCMSIAEYAVGE